MGAGDVQDKGFGYSYPDQGTYPPQQPYGHPPQAYPSPQQYCEQQEGPMMPPTQYYPPEYNPQYNQQAPSRSGGCLEGFLASLCCCFFLGDCCNCCSDDRDECCNCCRGYRDNCCEGCCCC